MTRSALLVILVACGSSSSEAPPAPVDPLPPPAPVSAPTPYQPAAKVAQDHAAEPDPAVRTKIANRKEQEAEAKAIADLLTAEGPSGVTADMSRRRPGAD